RGPRAIPLTMIGAVFGSLRLHGVADRYFRAAAESAAEVKDPGQAYVSGWIEGMHHYNFGRWCRGEKLIRNVLEQGKSSGDEHAVINSLSTIAIGAYHRGELRRCQAMAEQARELAADNAYIVLEIVNCCQIAAVQICRGEGRRAALALADRDTVS